VVTSPSTPPPAAPVDMPPSRPEVTAAPAWVTDDAAAPPAPEAPPQAPAGATGGVAAARDAAREALEQSRSGDPADERADPRALADAEADPDDPDADTNGLDSTTLLQQALGAQVIEEIKHT
jgi:DNA polymerase-3 subunit gamma/tau